MYRFLRNGRKTNKNGGTNFFKIIAFNFAIKKK